MKDAHKNFIEMGEYTIPDTNVFYATIIATLNEQLEEANELIKDYVHDANGCFTMGRIRRYLEKWGVK